MKRRNFLKALAAGTAAGSVLPARALAADQAADGAVVRDAQGALVERFSQDCRARSGMALGGIGAGTVELRKDGRFCNWNIFNNFPKETGPSFSLPEGEIEDPMSSNLFFKVRYEVEGEEPRIKLLQLPDGLNEGAEMGIAFLFPWMEAIGEIDYSARFPFARLVFRDAEMPFEIEMEAWTPFIPHDVKNSSLPLAYFDFRVRAKTTKRVHAMLLMVGRNNSGYETNDRCYVTEIRKETSSLSVSMGAGGMDETASSWGQIVLSSLAGDSSYYCGWAHLHPYYEQMLRRRVLPDIDDTNGIESVGQPVPVWLPKTHGRNRTDAKTGLKRVHDPSLYCTVAASFELSGAASEKAHTFVYAWNFPNLHAADPAGKQLAKIEGHYYSNFFVTGFDVAEYAIAQRGELHRRSREFVTNFFDSSAETFLLEQVNSQLNTFVTSGRLVKNGDFGVLEGLSATWSWGPIATIDVMVYGTAPIIALFPELQKATMRCHSRVQSAQGEIQHGLQKDFNGGEDGTAGVSHRLDLPSQYVILVLRDFFWTNDTTYLRELYPSVKKALDYVLTYRSAGTNEIPIMRGTESSYDNFPMYGDAAYVLSQWLCALASMVQAAEAMGDGEAKARYGQILEKARARMEDKLWNGSYYRLYNDEDSLGGHGGKSEGCLTDQAVGLWMAHNSGLGSLLATDRVRAALQSVLAKSYRPNFGLRNCSWPGAKYWSDIDADMWVDQGNTCWTGVELAFASFLLYEGFYREAMEVVRTVDQRYRKNGLYWNHQEFGGHYFRPMSAWAIVNGLLGFSVNQGRLRFDPKLPQESLRLFFATPEATAHFVRAKGTVRLCCRTGMMRFASVQIKGNFGGQVRGGSGVVHAGAWSQEAGFATWTPERPMTVGAGEEVIFSPARAG